MTTGIYKIINKITGECYIGQSVNVEARFSNHFKRDAKKYYGKDKFHTDIIDLGASKFLCVILATCKREELLEKEQYYYDLFNPTYNTVRPAKSNFEHPEVLQKARTAQKKPEFIEKMKRIHESSEFRTKCKLIHTKGKRQLKPVWQIEGNKIINEFDSLSEAGRWVLNNTKFQSKNPISKIKAVCDGERKSAFGYTWSYVEV